jgi:hypothetical protein
MKKIKKNQNLKSWRQHKRKRKKKISFDFSWLKKLYSRKLAISLATLLLIFTALYLLLFSDQLMIKNVTIEGNDAISSQDLNAAASNALNGKILAYFPANNFFLFSTKDLSKKLSAAFPEILSIDISKKFPGSLKIAIQEKQPSLVWCRTTCYFINAQGVAIMPASDEELSKRKKHYIKVIEESPILEETTDGKPDTGSTDQKQVSEETIPTQTSTTSATTETEEAQTLLASVASAAQPQSTMLADIKMNDQISDDSFIQFALKISDLISKQTNLSIKYYKTRGYKTRELIAFTDKNTRIYFDTTQDAKKQADNLEDFLGKGVTKGAIDGLKYIYLKNTDRIFYK